MQDHPHAVGPVHLGATVPDEHLPPSAPGLQKHQQATDASALVLIVIPSARAGSQGQREARLRNHLLTEFIQAHHRTPRVIGPLVQRPEVFPPGDERRLRRGWKAPRLLLPRNHRVFLSTCRTVSWDKAPPPHPTTRSASSRKVQCLWPGGALLVASSISGAAVWASHLYAPRGRGRGCKAAAYPASTKRWRTRATVRNPTPKTSAISWSVRRSPAALASVYSRIRAGWRFRAAAFPEVSMFRTCSRSSSVRVTLYFRSPGMAVPLLLKTRFLDHQKDVPYGHTSQSKFDETLVSCSP